MLLKQVQARAPGKYLTLLETLAAATRSTLEESVPMAWLPVEIDVEVIQAIAPCFDRAVFESLLASRMREELGSVLFNTFLRTMTRLSGATPATVVKHFPAGWNQLFSDCGTVTPLDSKPGESRLVITGLPPVCTAAEPWIRTIPIGIKAVCDTVGLEAAIEGQFHEAAKGTVFIVVRW